jgi:hypothetical protein
MTQDEIIEMATEVYGSAHADDIKFAKLVAKHTLMNIDPSKFIGGYREGFEAGVAKEREACAKICDEFCYGNTKILVEKAIRLRGETE